jgi:hypothetical protein
MPKSTKHETGYTHCACRDCFEIAIGEPGSALCHGCEAEGCEAGAERECSAPHAYGGAEAEEAEVAQAKPEAKPEDLVARRNAHAVEALREITEDRAPEASDFGATAKMLNMNRFAPPSGKRWTANQVKAAYEAYCKVNFAE